MSHLRTLILGLGATGFSCARHLARRGLGFEIMDSRVEPPHLTAFRRAFPNNPVHVGALDAARIAQADEIILSPGLDPKLPALAAARAAGKPIVGDIELFSRAAQAPILAITGTNGKGTVTSLIGEMMTACGLAVEVGGNIGVPALDMLEKPTPDFYVLELSSFQLETTYSLKPRVAAFLNLSEDHLDRHGSLTAYRAAKQRIYRQCQHAVWNRDDEATQPSTALPFATSFGHDAPPTPQEVGFIQHAGEPWLAQGCQRLLNLQSLSLQGCHNGLNALAALAMGAAIGLPQTGMLEALRCFKGLPHRCERVAEHQGIVWVDDSKGTNVGATRAAITGIGPTCTGQLVLIAGGDGKGADFSPLRAAVTHYVKAVMVFGQDAPLLTQALAGTVPVQRVCDLKAAVQQAAKWAQPGDAVLLSPACASWDMFRDYTERGQCFQKEVKSMLGLT